MKYRRPNSFILCLWGLLFLLGFSQSLSAGSNPFLVSDELDLKIKAGMDELYSLHFDKSLKIFSTIQNQAPEHPMVAFGVAAAHWWRISTLVLEADPKESAPFLEAVDNCLRLSEAKIKKGDPTGEGHLVYGGALGLKGRWEATNRQWLSAYWSGKKAYKYLVKSLTINPEMKDAYMGRGIFDYYVATLPAIVRVLAFLGMGGDTALGLGELNEAAASSRYAQTSSKLFLVQIYNELEGRPEEGQKILSELKAEYPASPFIHMLSIISFYNHGTVDQLKAESDSFSHKIDEKTFSLSTLSQAKFFNALALFKAKKWGEAGLLFEETIQISDPKDPWRTWGTLYLGYCFDAEGKRKEAIQQYKDVLKSLRRWSSHDNAEKRLKNPFQGTDADIKKITL